VVGGGFNGLHLHAHSPQSKRRSHSGPRQPTFCASLTSKRSTMWASAVCASADSSGTSSTACTHTNQSH
jgi:hypothetical protein